VLGLRSGCEQARRSCIFSRSARYAKIFGGQVAIHDNPSLAQTNLNQVKVILELAIENNASLATVDMNSLQTVDALRVTGNPNLATETFTQLATSSSTISGNLTLPAP
jgi:hypothetical protein